MGISERTLQDAGPFEVGEGPRYLLSSCSPLAADDATLDVTVASAGGPKPLFLVPDKSC